MNNNTFWILFWIIVFSYLSFSSYMKYKSVKIRSETDERIAKINATSNQNFQETMKNMAQTVSEVSK